MMKSVWKKSRIWVKAAVLILLAAAITLSLAACVLYPVIQSDVGELPEPEESNARYDALPNYANGRFRNFEPMVHNIQRSRGITGLVSRFILSNPKGPDFELPVVKLTRANFTPPAPDRLKIYWMGHSFVILEIDGVRILADPVFGNAGPLSWVIPRFQPPPLERGELPEIDLVLISHDHYDHLEKKTAQYLRDKNIPILTALGVGDRLRGWGIAPERITELNWGESMTVKGVTLTAQPARHFSGRYLDDRDRTLWAAFVIAGPRHKVFFAGDGGYGSHFKAIGETFGPFDLTMLEIGSWSDNWPNSHLFPEETVRAHLDLRGKTLLPIHWGVFDMAFHRWNEPIERFVAAADREKIDYITPQMGEAVDLDRRPTRRNWWRQPPEEPEKQAAPGVPETAGPTTEGLIMLKAGDPAPNFTLSDQDGKPVSLADFAGRKVVVYFYPKDNTPGCTRQACAFRDGFAAFRTAGVAVLGISKDSAESHRKFADEYQLPFTLLADPELVAIKAFGVWQEKKLYGKVSMGVVRSTFIIDERGVVEKVFPKVDPAANAAEILDYLGKK